jgi:hypothetical protein
MIKQLLALVLFSHAAFAEPVKLGHTIGPAGVTCTEVRSNVVKASANGRSFEQKDSVAKTIEILAVGPTAVSKAKVTYTAYGKGDAIVGQSYLVTFDNGAVKLARADGKPLSPAEQKLLEKDNKRFGKPDVFAEALVGIAFEKGKKTVIPADKLAAWEEFPQPIAATMTLLDRKGATATFTVEIKAGSAGGQQLALKGKAILDIATGRVLSLDGDGTFSDAKVTGTIHTAATEACGKQ